MLGKPVSVAKEWDDLQVEVTNLSSLVIAGCLRIVYKFSLPTPPHQRHSCLLRSRVTERVSQRGYSPFEKGHNLPGRLKIIINLRTLVLVGLKAAT